MANSVTILIKAKDQASTEIDKVKGKLNAVSSSQGFKSVVQGVGMGIGMSAWGLLTGAVSGAGQALGDIVQSGLDAQASQARLSAALKSSITGWDGNLDFINKNIDASMKLGFSDDDLRDSLARLLPITKGVGEAQTVQAAAMDLARFKSISLVDASLAIGKAMEGNKKMLKELGIDVKDAADAQQTLAEVQKVVAGQSAAYMETAAGKLEAVQVRIDNLKQGMGEWIANQGNNLALAADFLTWDPEKYGRGPKDQWAHFDKGQAYAQWINDMASAQDLLNRQMAAGGAKAKDLDMALADMATGGARLGSTLNPALGHTARASQDAADAFSRVKSRYDDMMARLTATNDLKELPLRIKVAQNDVVQAQKDLNHARTKADRDAAALRLQEAKDELATLRLEYSSAKATAAAYTAGKKYGDALGRGLADSFTSATGRLNVDVRTTVHAGARALGGPVYEGGVYRVGETRPEYFIPKQDGYISPNAPTGGGGAPVTLNVQMDGATVAQLVDARLFYKAQLAPSR